MQRGPFTVTHAKQTSAPVKSISDRADLNMDAQRTLMKVHRKKTGEALAMEAWEQTKATRDNHRIFLLLLVGEARQYQLQHPEHLGESDLTKLAVADALVELIAYRMAATCPEDHYVALLQEMAQMAFYAPKRPRTIELTKVQALMLAH